MFDVDIGDYTTWWLPHPPNSMPAGCFLALSRLVKKYFADQQIKSNAGLPVPIVAVGKLGYPDLAEQALRNEDCDMIMLARPLLADPYWCAKAQAGEVSSIRPCISDQEGCIHEFVQGGKVKCSVNPMCGSEHSFFEPLSSPSTVLKTNKPKKIAIVGAGPAGIIAATQAAHRGHDVTLFEQRPSIGGMLIPGSRPRMKWEVRNYVSYLHTLVEQASRPCPSLSPRVASASVSATATAADTPSAFALLPSHGGRLRVNTNCAATVQLLSQHADSFDCVAVCTGGTPINPTAFFSRSTAKNLNTSNNSTLPANVIQAVDLLRNPELAKNAKSVVIVGGGPVGLECAQFLSYEMKKTDVTVLELTPVFLNGVCTANRGHLLRLMERASVKLWNCAQVKEIYPVSLSASTSTSTSSSTPLLQLDLIRNMSSSVPDPYCTFRPLLPKNIANPLERPLRIQAQSMSITADLVVLAMGLTCNRQLYDECMRMQMTSANTNGGNGVSWKEVHILGDASRIGRVFEAVHSGFALGSLF
eukprot:TRINITY_DN2276_c0_g1_i2.p1 TRINITY_DN2276_c0_g1~~TRINITY_DN2276_c0_g1_i2.p1  ORF type:complete len:530 (-),score=156.96 TRINITY_DN2276_c0_g1_i2:496-2085(-)